jgi:hypothetical protein
VEFRNIDLLVVCHGQEKPPFATSSWGNRYGSYKEFNESRNVVRLSKQEK